MAPANAGGLDSQNLSSNWKKLQEKWEAEKPRPPKRKAAVLQESHQNGKHRKLEHPLHPLSRPHADNKTFRMGQGWSSSKKKETPSASLARWAADNDISTKDLHAAYGPSLKSTTSIPDVHASSEHINQGLAPDALASAGKYVAIDCEMVGVGPNPDLDSALARVSIVNYHGHQLYDSFVQTKEPVTDYRSAVSGITPALLQSQARTLEAVQADVAQLLEGRILVGHAIRHDLDAIMWGHPRRDIRDTSRHPAFKLLAGGRTPGLKKLAREVLGVDIQGGEHSSIEDARATMLLFRKDKDGFEREHLLKWGPDRRTNEHVAGNDDEKRDNRHKTRETKKKKKKKKKAKR